MGTAIVRIGALTTQPALDARSAASSPAAPLLAGNGARRSATGRCATGARSAARWPTPTPPPTSPPPFSPCAATDAGARPGGRATIAADDFFLEFLTTALAPDEVLTEIAIPAPPARAGASYQKLANQASGLRHRRRGRGGHAERGWTCADARIAVTGAASVSLASGRNNVGVEQAGVVGDVEITAAAELADNGAEMLDNLQMRPPTIGAA